MTETTTVFDTEQFLQEAKVDINELKANYGRQHIIPREWYYDIIRYCIDNCGEKYENIIPNKKDNTITLQFEDNESCLRFEESFHNGVLSNIKRYLKEQQNVNPKEYSRNIILETKQDNQTFTIYW